MIAGAVGRIDPRAVLDQLGVVLIGHAIEKPVVPVEAAAGRPLVERAGGRRVPGRDEVPLPGGERAVPCGVEDLGDRRGLVGDLATSAGEPDRQVGERPQAHRVRVPPGEQGRSRRRADGAGVEVVEAQSTCRQMVDVGGLDLRAVAAEVGEANVIQEEVDHVRTSLLRSDRWRVIGFRVLAGCTDDALEVVVAMRGGCKREGCQAHEEQALEKSPLRSRTVRKIRSHVVLVCTRLLKKWCHSVR